jgi:hypothetical protein
VVLSASGPWGQPHGPMVFLTVQWVSSPWNRSETTEIRCGSSSSSSSSPSSSPSWPHDEDPTASATRLGQGP